jgi:hypothetical protein
MEHTTAELEISLRWHRGTPNGTGPSAAVGMFDVNVAFDVAGDAEDQREFGDEVIQIDAGKLGQLTTDNAGYGRALTQMLFTSASIGKYWSRAREVAAKPDGTVHVRLTLDPLAPQAYHNLRWELLRDPDPDDDAPIATRQNIVFSRFVTSTVAGHAIRPSKHERRALVVIADPRDIDRFGNPPLARVDVAAERGRARAALDGMRVDWLAGPGQATLDNIADRLDDAENPIDLLYLVCHGALLGGESRLYLEDGAGNVAQVDGRHLADRIGGLPRRPVIAVLCSCQSAGTGGGVRTDRDGGGLTALGPRLASLGVPAVVAMQGDITVQTAGEFLTRFFKELGEDGNVHRAVAAARASVEGRRDWWMPVLFTRLRFGRTWYQPEFTRDSDFTWRSLIDAINEGGCTPILGPGLAEGMLGSRSEIASRWVNRWLMPISATNRRDLPKVTQYLRVRTARHEPAQQLRRHLAADLAQRYRDELPAELVGPNPEPIMAWTGERFRKREDDPFRVLADLELPLYVTTSWTNLLEDALRAADRTPTIYHFDWRHITYPDEKKPPPEPTVEKPLVIRLFGDLNDPESLVLSEDDHFEWLTQFVSEREEVISKHLGLSRPLTRQPLMFLGFGLDDWDFRIVFHALKSFPSQNKSTNVGVQISPESTTIDSEAAQEYLERYFGEQVRLFWGMPESFLHELQRRRGRSQ